MNAGTPASRLRRLAVNSILTFEEAADLRALLDDHAEDFVWEQWAVQLRFPGGMTTVEHDTEAEARSHYRQLLTEPRRADRIEVVRRVNVQGTYRAVADEDDDAIATAKGHNCDCSGCPNCGDYRPPAGTDCDCTNRGQR